MIEANETTERIEQSPVNKAGRLHEMRKAGQPILLSINGTLEFVVEDDASYGKLLELVDHLDTIEAIREGLREVEAGKGMSLEEFKEAVRRKYGLPL